MLIIKPAAIIDRTGSEAQRGQAVVVDNGRIEWVGRAADLSRDLARAEVIDAPDCTLLPGLIDGHVHLMCPAERCAAETYLAASDEQLLVRAVAKAQAGLHAGVTTMRDLGSRNFLLLALRDAINAGQLSGPRLILAGPALTRRGGHFHYLGWEADSAEELSAAVQRVCAAGVDVVKVMATGGHTTPGSHPLKPQFSAEQLRAAVEQAHSNGRRLTAHAHGVDGIRNAVEAGVDCIEHCSWLGPEGTAFDPDLGKRIVDQGICVSPTFGARSLLSPEELAAIMPPDEVARLLRNQGRYQATQRMVELGARVIASSDAGMAAVHTHEFAKTLEVLVKRVGMSELAAIRAATSAAAEALDIAHQTGTIARGKRADLLLVDGDPSRDITALQRVRCVLRDGRVHRPSPAAAAEALLPQG